MTRRPRPPLIIWLLLSVALLGGAVGTRDGLRAQEPEAVAARLGGVILPRDEAAFVNSLRPVAVIVDNWLEARPQIGLDRADLVYELLVEGGITRFMAVYQGQEVDWVEPVRSARTPFLPLARELGAVLGHVGAAGTAGPTDTETQFGDWGVLHLDEQFNPGPFWRDPDRAAPHNAATSTIELRGHATGLGWDGPGEAGLWLFKDDLASLNGPSTDATTISYAFTWDGPPRPEFAVDWQYDAESNAYSRSMAGRPHVDGRSGGVLIAKNVIVQFDSAEIVNGEGHILYGGLGEGPAYVFLDGQRIDATWTKPTREERTRYWDLNGVEIHFNRGSTWVAILPYGSPLTWE
ncbi:MAG: DUF3048 domain-containing protein [Dehalococcoidia bacterium]